MDQVLLSLKKPGLINLDVLDERSKELVILGNILQYGQNKAIFDQVKMAYKAGAKKEEIIRVASFVFRNDKILDLIIELVKSIDYEEKKYYDILQLLMIVKN